MSENSASRAILKGLLLKPLSVVYGAITATRNKMFDYGVLEQRDFDIPIVVVGNIAVGGTGKTPHVEYLIDLLRKKYHIGVLSRGYNRRTKGFVHATAESTARQIGDEPYQIFRKFRDEGVTVAVCEDRVRGIERMREIDPKINLIILDDAFQHRYVKPSVSVVLTEYSHPVFEDEMMPAGRLRESAGALNRADVVIVTKCPDSMKQIDYRIFTKNINLQPWQQLYFSTYTYGNLEPLYPDLATTEPDLEEMTSHDTIVIVAGIASPKPFIKHIRQSRAKVTGLIFSDHHNFKRGDIEAIVAKIKAAPDPRRAIVVTTEKDAMRLRDYSGLPNGLKKRIFYLPVAVKIISTTISGQQGGQDFAENIESLISKQ